jgi:hypothetical protein
LKLAAIHSRRDIHKAKLSPLPDYMRAHGGEDETIEESLPVAYDDHERGRSTTHLHERGTQQRKYSCGVRLPSWEASGRWSLRKDGVLGLLELARALIGYLLYVFVHFRGYLHMLWLLKCSTNCRFFEQHASGYELQHWGLHCYLAWGSVRGATAREILSWHGWLAGGSLSCCLSSSQVLCNPTW